MNNIDGSLNFVTKVDDTGFNQSTKNLGNGISGISKSLAGLGKAAVAIFLVKKALDFGKEAISIASDLQEVQNVVDTAFGSMTYKVEEFANTAIEQFGISKLTAKETASTFMAMSKGIGMSLEEGSNMSIEATKRMADIMSFYNKTAGESSTMLKSIWTGETESLKNIGVVMTEVNLENFRMAQGYNKAYSAMTQAEKVQLRYAYVMQQTSLAAGDFAKTSDSWANQTRMLSERFKELLGIIGSGLIQLVTPIVKGLNTIMQKLIDLANVFSSVVNKIFGKTNETQSKMATSAIETSKAENKLAAATKKAGKEANKSTSGFDELNILTSNIAENAEELADNLGSETFGIDTEISEPTNNLNIEDENNSMLDRMAASIKNWASSLTPYWNGIKTSVQNLGNSLMDLWNTPLIQWIANRVFSSILVAINNGIKGLCKIFEGLIDIITGVVDMLTGLLTLDFQKFGDGVVKVGLGILKLGEGIIIAVFGENVAQFLKDTLTAIVNFGVKLAQWWNEKVAPYFEYGFWIGLFGMVFEGTKAGWNIIKNWWDTSLSDWWNNSVKPWFTKEKWIDVMSGITQSFKTVFKNAVNIAIELFNKLIGWINEKLHFEWDAVRVAGKTIVPAGSVQLFTIPKIPKLATGTVVPANYGEFQAILGDNKREPEIVSPLSTMKQALKEALIESGNSGGDITVVLELDSREFGRACFKYGNLESKRKGVQLRSV